MLCLEVGAIGFGGEAQEALQRAFQFKCARILAEIEHPEETKVFSITCRETMLISANEKWSLVAANGGLDLDETFLASWIETEDVVACTVAFFL